MLVQKAKTTRFNEELIPNRKGNFMYFFDFFTAFPDYTYNQLCGKSGVVKGKNACQTKTITYLEKNNREGVELNPPLSIRDPAHISQLLERLESST